MTIRGIIIGLIMAVLMGAGGAFASKHVPGMWGLVRGNLPVSVFGALIVFVAVINPLLRRIHKSLRFSAGELALILSLTLIGCGIADAGLMRYFPKSLVQPMQLERSRPGWQQKDILGYAPDSTLPNKGVGSPAIVDNYITAMGTEGDPIGLGEVPWSAWKGPLKVWVSIIAFMFAGVICLAMIVHRQWAEKERIRYPLAEIATSLFERDDKGDTKLFKNRMFWIGASIPFALMIINGLNAWFPGFPSIPLTFNFSALASKFPELAKITGARAVTSPTIMPAALGLSFLLASDIGFTLGIAPVISMFAVFIMMQIGVDISGGRMEGGFIQWQSFGSFMAMAVMLLYVGRRYYWHTLSEAVTFQRREETSRYSVWACRGFIICVVGATGVLMAVGLDVVVALLAVLSTTLLYLVCARMNAEAGTFFFVPNWTMPAVLVGIFGMTVLGPTAIIVLGLMMYLLMCDPFETMMPFISNGLKITSDTRLPVSKVGGLMIIALLLMLAVAVPLSIWADYNYAAPMRRGYDTEEVFSAADKTVDKLELSGQGEEVANYGALDRIANMLPDKQFLVATGIGFGLLMLFSFLRLKYTWWPLHPILFLVFASGPFFRFAPSFFLGWVLKSAVTKFGGAAQYLSIKPFVLGVIIGDLTGGFFWLVVGWVYNGVTGYRSPSILLW